MRCPTWLGEWLLHVPDDTSRARVGGRALGLAALAVWGGWFATRSIRSNGVGDSFLHLVDLVFHEAGHILFSPFGAFMGVFGGSLLQVLVPMVCTVAFVVKTRDPFAGAVGLWWTGQNLIDLAPYIADARRLQLLLLGGVTGSDVTDYHDWERILGMLGLKRYDQVIAHATHGGGVVLMMIAIAWGAAVLRLEHRSLDTVR